MALAYPTKLLQFCTVTKNWREACKPWVKLGKKFHFITLSEKNVSNYIVRGVPQKKVDFVVEIAYTMEKAEIEVIQPISGPSFYRDCLELNQGRDTLHHIAIGPSDPNHTVKDLFRELERNTKHLVSFDVGNPKRPSVTAHYFEVAPNQIVELWDEHDGGEGPIKIPIVSVEDLV